MKNKSFVFLIALSLTLLLFVSVVYASQNETNGSNGNGNGNGHNWSIGDNESDNNETDDDFNETELDDNETERNKTHTFVPWQKRDEQNCPEECECHGAVVSCETETGKIITITAGNSGNMITIVIDKIEINTTLEIEQEGDNETNKSKFHAKKSNGKKSEIKIMLDVAAERALERLKLKVCNETNNCTIVLKEVGNDKNTTDNRTVEYELQVQRHARVLGIFQAKAQERAEVNAETGEVKIYQPWWAFLATKED